LGAKVEAQFIGQEIFRSCWDYQKRFVAAFQAVNDFANGSIAAGGCNKRAIVIDRCLLGQLAGMGKRLGEKGLNLLAGLMKVIPHAVHKMFAAAGSRFGIDNQKNVSVCFSHFLL
jgi:hypothetical protein